ncbi:hypothetical protein MRX96_052817 [Rhipicephalus microplus]
MYHSRPAGQHYSLEVPVPPQQRTSSMDQQEDDIQEALALHNMRQMRPLEHLGDSLSSREDSADEAPPLPLDQQPLPPFDAFYSSCLLFEDPSHFGGCVSVVDVLSRVHSYLIRYSSEKTQMNIN